jgi:putative transposase
MSRTFSFFKPRAETEITRRNLPHWQQEQVCYFLTFRTSDSLPANVRKHWSMERNEWLAAHGISTSDDNWHQKLAALPEEKQKVFHQTFSKKMHEILDAGHGECLLRRTELRQIMVDALKFFDGSRYWLGGYVIMPNHVHVLFQSLVEDGLKHAGYSWKHFTAHEIHKKLGRVGQGNFWMGESYDHIVRSKEQFLHYQKYIRDNPQKAGLRDGEFSVFLPEDVEFL